MLIYFKQAASDDSSFAKIFFDEVATLCETSGVYISN
jgi:hypothetical protein